MKKIKLTGVLFIIVLALTSNYAFSNDLLNYLSNENTFIINVNAKSFFSSSFYKEQLTKKDSKITENIAKMKDLEKKLGISFEKITNCNIGFHPNKKGANIVQVAINIKANRKKVITFIKNDKTKVEKIEEIPYKNQIIIKVTNKKTKDLKKAEPALKKLAIRKNESYMCVLKDVLFVASGLDSMKQMIDLYSGTSKESISNSDIAKYLDLSKMISASGIISDEMKDKFKNNPQSAMFTAINIINFYIDLSSGFELNIKGVCENPDSASQIATTLKAFTGMYGFMLMQYGLQSLMANLTVDSKANNAIINLKLSKDDIELITQKLQEMKKKRMNKTKKVSPAVPGMGR